MKTVAEMAREKVSLQANVATEARSITKSRRLNANRMPAELIESGIEAGGSKQQEFFDLAESFQSANAPKAIKRLGDQLGRMIFA